MALSQTQWRFPSALCSAALIASCTSGTSELDLSISEVAAFEITPNTAKIGWTLDMTATGQVEYGTTTSYGQWSVKEDSFDYAAHVQQLSGLTPNTIYHFRVRSANEAGAESVSGDFTFTTGVSVSTSCATKPTSSVVVDVTSHGATPDDLSDDTAKIQAAIAAVPAGGTVLVPDGTYMIDAVTSLRLKSNMTFTMTSGAVLKAITNSSDTYAIIMAYKISNVNILGGTIRGERTTHTGKPCSPIGRLCGASSDPSSTTGMTGQWGMGIHLEGTTNVVIEGVRTQDNWGDGVYIGGAHKNIHTQVCSIVSDNNRRQGMSIVYADDVVVTDSVFRDTWGQMPEAGIDIEPNPRTSVNPGTNVNNVTISNSTIQHNAASGISAYLPGAAPTATTYLTNVTISGNTVERNGKFAGIVIASAGSHRITNNVIRNNASVGIVMDKKASQGVITGNTISSNQYVGIQLKVGTTANTVSGNTITGHSVAPIQDLDGHNIITQ